MNDILIPTRYKSKLAAEFSYPIGAELLTEHLKDVPQFSTISLHFSDAGYPKAKFRKTVLSDEEYIVTEVRYNGNRPQYSTDWSVCIYPVRRELKKTAKDALVSFGLPTLAKWLANHNVQNSFGGGLGCLIMFIPLEGYVYLRAPLSGFEQRPEIQKGDGKIQLSGLPISR